MLRRTAAVLGLALLTAWFSAPVASADVDCVKDVHTGQCLISAEEETPGDTQDGSAPSGGGGPRVCHDGSVEVPCYLEGYGYWYDGWRCWVGPAWADYPPDNPVWEGNTTGAIYDCWLAVGGQLMAGQGFGSSVFTFWAETNPAAPVDVDALVRRAVEQMGLRAGTISTNPSADAGSMTYVGLDTWLWIADPGESTTGPITRSATAGGTTVTATATLDRVEWGTGDGTTVTCDGPGTPYDAGRPGGSTDCSHVYGRSSAGQPGLRYTVTATSYWTVAWTGAGTGGTLDLDFSSSADLAVGEIQVVVE